MLAFSLIDSELKITYRSLFLRTGGLEFNVSFQDKYGYIRDEIIPDDLTTLSRRTTKYIREISVLHEIDDVSTTVTTVEMRVVAAAGTRDKNQM